MDKKLVVGSLEEEPQVEEGQVDSDELLVIYNPDLIGWTWFLRKVRHRVLHTVVHLEKYSAQDKFRRVARHNEELFNFSVAKDWG